jgi:predicted GTPase
VTAATQEARDRLSKALVHWGRDEVARRLVQTYVREVGRAAIDLYGGRLRVSAEALEQYVSPQSAADASTIGAAKGEPLRILVAGQGGAGKSSLVNALAGAVKAAVDVLPATASFTSYALKRPGFPPALIIDSPGLGPDPHQGEAIADKAADCDLVLWVVAAHRADRNIDKQALETFRRNFATRLNRRRPPVILVVSHIDRLRPFEEWAPPYDLAASDREKAANIRAATGAAAADLGFGAAEAVPVSMMPEAPAYNVDALWAKIAEALPEATRVQLLRCLADLKGRWNWSSVWSQTLGAGRAITESLKRQRSG